ncbi:MAG: class II aldolase/adducin family protein [Verrucomicrobiaceae bacterium]|nr:MAG: class II aldolase/adducin family protein [Verrucomicrobiaceae bacterium]
MTERDILHPADRLVAAMERIYGYRMTTTSGGNLSIRDDDGTVWITPARIDKGNLRREDIVAVLPDGTVQGRHKPSSELPFHLGIYRVRPDLRGIVHAHPVALVAFSICGRAPETRLFPKSHAICGEVGFAPYALPGSALLGEKIAEVFAHGHSCAMLENHGVVVGGANFQEAFTRFETLEFTAKTLIKASALGAVTLLNDEQLALTAERRVPDRFFQPGHAASRERELRRDLCDFVRRGYKQRLLISSQGTFSARIQGEEFLMTPAGADRAAIRPGDIVLAGKQGSEAGKPPSRALPLHAAIYRAHPSVQAIAMATPVNATAYSVSRETLDTRTIPESYIFLRDVARIPFEAAYGDPDAFAARCRPDFPVSLLENDGVMVLGTSLLDAFDRLEVLESTAEALINSKPLGAVRPMDDGVITELVREFLNKSA